MADAAVALAFLRGQPGVSPACAALLGHSEGALAAAALATEAPDGVRGLVLLATPGRKGHEIMDQARRDAFERAGAPPAQIQQVERLQARLYQAARTGTWDGIPPEIRARAGTPWFREIIDVDPLAALRRVRAHALPVLIIHGEADQVLPPRYEDAERSAKALWEGSMRAGGAGGRVRLVRVPGADHHLRLGAEIAPEALGAISAFLREVFTLPLPRPACWRR